MMRLVVAATHRGRRNLLCQKLSEHLPHALLVPVSSPEALEEAIRSDTPRSVILSADLCTMALSPDSLTDTIRQCNPDIHIVWVLPRQANAPLWLDRAQAYDFDILVQPVNGLVLAQRCLCAQNDAYRLQLANKRLAMLAQRRSESLYESDER
ncbi:MAG: hypothetical protein L3K26_18745, partial [Candidatus Hydrogenedentes bacterium]|nr:hypothetical protein [Candidatus Hydrogenedentota bacterium]